jgi:hypothetical protein
MENDIVFSEMKINEINSVSNMANKVFDEFVGMDYSENGKETFKDYITPKNILERYSNGTSHFYIAKYIDEVIGILEIRNRDHVSLFFFCRKNLH